jgi:hypothetical protein
MAGSTILSLLVVVLGQAAVTLVAAGPRPTPLKTHFKGVDFGFTPRPTQPPGFGLLGMAQQLQHAIQPPLAKRQASDATICEYENGIESMSFYPCLRSSLPPIIPTSSNHVSCRLMLLWQLEYVPQLYCENVRQQARQYVVHSLTSQLLSCQTSCYKF